MTFKLEEDAVGKVRMKVLSTAVLVGSIGLAFPASVSAGQLLLTNVSDKPISCKVEGYEKVIVVPPAVTAQLHPNMGQSDPASGSKSTHTGHLKVGTGSPITIPLQLPNQRFLALFD